MGYEPSAVEKRYGRALNEASHDPVSFNKLFNARLNRKPQWVTIDPANVVQPPRADIHNSAQARTGKAEASFEAGAETFFNGGAGGRSEEHTSELQSLMRISYARFCLKKKNNTWT